MSRKWIFVALLAGLTGVLTILALRREKMRPISSRWPVNVAHRGASAEFPENTIASLEAGITAGAGGLELDVHMTRDGHVVVFHDDTVDRITDGSGAVRDMTLAELQALDAGYRFSPDDGATYPYRGRGLRAPTLSEVFRDFPEAFVNLEIKEAQPGIEQAVLRVIEDAHAEDRALVISQDSTVTRRFREISGGRISTGASRREITAFFIFSKLCLEGWLNPSYDALQIPPEHRGVKLLTPRFLEAAHNRGARVDVWTINEPAEMRRVLDLGADVIMTDRPGRLAKVLAERWSGHRAFDPHGL